MGDLIELTPRAACNLWGAGSLDLAVKRVLVVALIAVVLFTGIPLVVAMPMTDCGDCGVGLLVAGMCVFAVLAGAAAAALLLLALELRNRAAVSASLIATSGLYRPPRLA